MGQSTADHHSHKSHPNAICVTACCGVIAVLGIAPQLMMPVWHLAGFPPVAHLQRAGATTLPDPFPPHLAHALESGLVFSPVRGQNATRDPVPVSGDAKWPMADARRRSSGPRTAARLERISKAQIIHGCRSAEIIALRRELAEWSRRAGAVIKAIE